jgi:DNA-nicking Smr family endonuclease
MPKKPAPVSGSHHNKSAADTDLWRSLLSTTGVAPLKKKKPRINALSEGSMPSRSNEKVAKTTVKQVVPVKKTWKKLDVELAELSRRKTSIVTSSPPLAAIDKKAKKKISSGRVTIDATLDLHGMRQDDAHRAVVSFIQRCHRRGCRTLLVITGKGRVTAEGVLKKNLAHWLAADDDVKKCILSFSESAPQHGGAGAYYVMLRKAPS